MSWFRQPEVLVSNPQKFWPSSSDSNDEQINSVSRFIIYGSIVSYAIKRDKRIFVACLLILFALFAFTRFRHVTPFSGNEFNKDDPMGNFKEFKKYDKENVRKTMNEVFPVDTANAERAFFTMPSNDLQAYLDFVHGGKNKPFCRQDQTACSADDNPRMMEAPHLRAVTNIPVFL